jgi:hypothetical protein
MKTRILIASLFFAAPIFSFGAELTVQAVNKLQIARANQTIELSKKDLAPLSAEDLARVHIKDSSGKELVCQAVDTDFDALHTPDIVIFQADFGANETKTFTVSSGGKHEFKMDEFKAFGRFSRERFDDFAWENDRIAHRTYGKALETWEGEPLSSSTIDIWSKRTPRMVINEWYMLDNYHEDMGNGADFYSAGVSRGCGGNGLWAADRLWTSRNFVNSHVLANGPIRVMFELIYEPFDVNGVSVAETKRISLDAGQNLDHFQSTYKVYSLRKQPLTSGIGLKKVAGEQKEANPEHGWLVKWEKMEKNAGNQGLAIVIDPKLFEKQAEDKLNQLVLAKVPDNGTINYWAGFCWDKAAQFTSLDAWKKYVNEFAQGAQSPIEVTVAGK